MKNFSSIIELLRGKYNVVDSIQRLNYIIYTIGH